MKPIRFVLLLVALLSLQETAFSQTWQLVWQDEFTNSIGPDWVFETGNGTEGWGNLELEYYRRENATVENGQLVITAKRESIGGYNYTSTRMKTQGKKSWKYGKMEARINFPAFTGAWPSFWMLGENISTVNWPSCGEIDVTERINTDPKTYGTIHWADANGVHAQYGTSTSIGLGGYHTYTVEWDASSIKWFVDGVKFNEANILNGVNSTQEFHKNFFLLLNFAIGGRWPGHTVDNSAFPSKMYVDYVRVYQKSSGGGNPGWTLLKQAETYDNMLGVQKETCTDTGGGQNVSHIDSTDWVSYHDITFPSSGNYKIEYRVASLNGGGRLSQDLNGGNIILGAINVPKTNGWQTWTTISQTVHINAGTYNFGIYAVKGGWNINWWRITKL